MAESCFPEIFEGEEFIPSSSSQESVSSTDGNLVETIVGDQDGQQEAVLVQVRRYFIYKKS